MERLQALRRVGLIAAATFMVEAGDVRRFETPRRLMACLGLVPPERSTGDTVRRGGITKTGDARVRRVLAQGACPGHGGRLSPVATVPIFGATKLSTGSNTAGKVTGCTVLHDAGGGVDAAAGTWTVAEDGVYLVAAQGFPCTGTPQNVEMQVQLRVNDAVAARSRYKRTGGGGGACGMTGGLFALSAGDAVDVASLGDGLENVLFSAVLAASDPAASASKANATGAAGDVVSGYAEQVDVGGDFDLATGVFTAPADGLYHVKAQGYPSALISGADHKIQIVVNDVAIPALNAACCWDASFGDTLGTSVAIPLSAGDELVLRQAAAPCRDVRLTVLKIPAGTAFAAHSATGTTLPTGWTEAADTASAFDAAAGGFTAPADGVHLFGHAENGVVTPSPSGEIQSRILVDGAVVAAGRSCIYGATHRGAPAVEILQPLTAGQQVTFATVSGDATRSCIFGRRAD